MPFDPPFTMGPFVVDGAGRLTPDAGAAPSFHLVWRGRSVTVSMRDGDDGLGSLKMTMVLGRTPSTAPSGVSDARDRAFDTIRQLPQAAPPGWHIGLLPDHRIALRMETTVPLPASAVSLVTELTVLLLAVDPYLTLLEEAGLGFAASGSAVGTAKTCPG